MGRTGSKVSTKRNAGTAMSGCGRLENTLQAAARPADTPRGTRTRLIARPSGTLWAAIAIAITSPSSSPLPKETPTATPSVNECIVMMPTIRSILVASTALKAPTWSSRSLARTRRVTTRNNTPRAAPTSVCTGP
jgi:hypothetical protein